MLNIKIFLFFTFNLGSTSSTFQTLNPHKAKTVLSNHYYNDDRLDWMISDSELSMNVQELDYYKDSQIWTNSFSTVEVIVELKNVIG